MIKYTHSQLTPYNETYYFNNYDDALDALKYLWKHNRKMYYELDSYYDNNRKRYHGSFKYKIFPRYHTYLNGDTYGEPYEYYINWRKRQ